MKQKKVFKKLNLNKKTVVDLDKSTMSGVPGGAIDISAIKCIDTLSEISYCVGCPTVLSCDTCAPETCGCGGNTYETCNEDMCGTVYPFACK
jgi:hypothetical protein